MWAEPAGWGQNASDGGEKVEGEGGRGGPHGEKRALPNSQRILSLREAWHSSWQEPQGTQVPVLPPVRCKQRLWAVLQEAVV